MLGTRVCHAERARVLTNRLLKIISHRDRGRDTFANDAALGRRAGGSRIDNLNMRARPRADRTLALLMTS